MEKLTKKKKCIKVFLQESKLIKETLVVLALTLLCILDNRISSTILLGIFIIVFVSSVIEDDNKLETFKNYCYLPLTEDEVRNLGFTSVLEYFDYLKRMLHFKNEENTHWSNYFQLSESDLNKILIVCLKVFPDNDIFTLWHNDCSYICNLYYYDFVRFFDTYHETYEKNNNYVPSVNINKEGIVTLSVLNTYGHGIVWNGKKMLVLPEEFAEENEQL